MFIISCVYITYRVLYIQYGTVLIIHGTVVRPKMEAHHIGLLMSFIFKFPPVSAFEGIKSVRCMCVCVCYLALPQNA